MHIGKVSVYRSLSSCIQCLYMYVFEVTEIVFGLLPALMQPEGDRRVSIKKLTCYCIG